MTMGDGGQMPAKAPLTCTLAWGLLLPLAYLLLIGRLGWSHLDDGFILGNAWRVFQGELIYRDFFYVRPPGSVYLHALWYWLVPRDWVYFTGRAVYCLQIMVYSMVAAHSLAASPEAPVYLKRHWRRFAAVGFIMSACMLTPFPWHTVDGIFFGTLGAAMLLTPKPQSSANRLKHLLGGVLLVMAALCKQSFYPWPLVVMAILVAQGERSKALWCLTGVVFTALVTSLVLHHLGIWESFRLQTTGNVTLADAFFAGVAPYLKSFVVLALPALLVNAAALRLAPRWGISHWTPSHAANLFAVTVAVIWLARWAYYQSPTLAFINLWLDQTFWLASIYWVLMRILDKKPPWTWLAWLILAWCTSISWGFMSTGLFFLPILMGTWMFLYSPTSASKNTSFHIERCGFPVVLLLVMSLFRALTHEGNPASFACALGKTESAFSGVFTTQANCDKLADMRDIVTRLKSQRLLFLPSFTTGYMQFGLRNPLPLDYLTNAEAGTHTEKIRKMFHERVEYVLIEKSTDIVTDVLVFRQPNPTARFYVPLIPETMTYFIDIGSTEHFMIYKNPKALPTGAP